MRNLIFLFMFIMSMSDVFCNQMVVSKSALAFTQGVADDKSTEHLTFVNQGSSAYLSGAASISIATNYKGKFVIPSGSASKAFSWSYKGNGLWSGVNTKTIMPAYVGDLSFVAMDGSKVKVENCKFETSKTEVINIALMPCPTPAILGPAAACRNTSIALSVDTFTLGNSYQWTATGGATISNAVEGRATINIPLNPTGPIVITLSETDVTNCVGTTTLALSVESTEALVCDNDIAVSLGDNCTVDVTASIVLEGQTFPDSSYNIVIKDTRGNVVPKSLVGNTTFINKPLIVTVTHICSGLSCWGNIKFEDKLAPTITCPRPDTVSCFSTQAFNNPPAADNCGGSVTVTVVNNTLLERACGSEIAAERTIVYRATDAAGNTSVDCVRKIFYEFEDINDVVYPKDYDGLPGNNPILTCENNPRWDLNANYYPDIAETGVPTLRGTRLIGATSTASNNNLCKINSTFTDDTIKICERSYKLLRNWTVLDWCSGEIISKIQVIKVADNKGPIVTCEPDFRPNVVTSPYTCTADVKLPKPIVIFDCSKWDYTVQYLLADVNGAPPINGLYISTNVVRNADSTYTVRALPKGLTWIKYLVRDECGNTTECLTEVYVRDFTPPVTICHEFTVASVSSTGEAQIKAESLNDGSYDNCGKISLQIARVNPGCNQGTEFGPAAIFCCSEIGTEQMAQLKVWDDANCNGIFGDVVDIYNDNNNNGIFGDGNDRLIGRITDNSNTCMTRVKVQDKTNPVITCPANQTIDCIAQTDTLYTGGGARAVDNCEGVVVTMAESKNVTSCFPGTITRTFTATDKSGNTATCRQVVTIEDRTPFGLNNINWGPVGNRDLPSCSSPNELSPDKQGRPTWTNAECTLIGAEYSDQEFPIVDDVCVKILRTWTVIDWCTFNRDNTKGKFTYIQVIKINNTNPPKFEACPKDTVVCVEGLSCGGEVTLNHAASDDCTPADKLQYIYTIDRKDNGSIDDNGGTATITRNLVPDVYRIKVTAKDICGNEQLCNYKLTVKDCKKPTPYCYSELVTVVMNSPAKNVSIWAKDFDKGSFDNCGPVRFAFSNNVRDTQKVFTCTERGLQRVKMYVIDTFGNADFCEVRINVQPTGDVCGPGSLIEGRITHANKAPMKNVLMTYTENGSTETKLAQTDADGKFSYNSGSVVNSLTLQASYDLDHMNGVNTLDLVYIQRHILGLDKFKLPNQLIAADVNKSGNINVSDLVSLRKLILGVNDKFINNTSYVFLTADNKFSDENNPYNYKSFYSENFVSGKVYDFTTIKVGDVNGSASTNFNSRSEIRSGKTTRFVLGESKKNSEGNIEVEVKAGEDMTVSGLQTTLAFGNVALKDVKIKGGVLNITEENYTKSNLQNDRLPISYVASQNKSVSEGEVLFTLVIDANTMGDVSMVNDRLSSEIYDENLTATELTLESRSGKSSNLFEVSQNAPNPFNANTSIIVDLGIASDVKLKVSDMTGKIVYQSKAHYAAGQHSININAQDLKVSGVLNYTVETSLGTITKKMVIVQ